jgi:hypothetical protein
VNSFPDGLNWALLFFSLSGMALMLRSLSRKLGEALHMKKYYRLFMLSILFFMASAAWLLMNGPDDLWPGLLFLVGAMLMVGVTVRYWGWIVPEMLRPNK